MVRERPQGLSALSGPMLTQLASYLVPISHRVFAAVSTIVLSATALLAAPAVADGKPTHTCARKTETVNSVGKTSGNTKAFAFHSTAAFVKSPHYDRFSANGNDGTTLKSWSGTENDPKHRTFHGTGKFVQIAPRKGYRINSITLVGCHK